MQEYEVGALPERVWEPARVKGFSFLMCMHLQLADTALTHRESMGFRHPPGRVALDPHTK